MSEQPPADAGTTEAAPSLETVEAVVRRQLATALGGRRGMIEAAVPTLLFTITWLTQRNLTLALTISVAAALVLLAVRLVQRTTPQFVLNALFGIGIGWVFVRISASRGGDEDAQALAYFLPGILYNGVYGLVFAFTCLIGWPVVGFMVGSVTGDPTAWHQDKQVVRLCTRLTWLLDRVAPSALVYLRVDDVRRAVQRCVDRGVVVESEPHVIFRHEDDALGPAGTDEWMAFVTDSEGNTVGLVSHAPSET